MSGAGHEEWTPAIGLRRVFFTLLRRSLICLPIWATIVWLIAPVLNYFPLNWRSVGGLALALAIPGVVLGYALGRNLSERAGFASPVLTTVAVAFACGVVVGGVEVAEVFRPLHGLRDRFSEIIVGVFATLLIVRTTLLDD